MNNQARSIIKDIEKGGNFILVKGEEAYFKDQVISAIHDRFLDESTRDFNYSKYYISATSIGNVITTAMNIPMMSDYRLVYLVFDKVDKELEKKEYLNLLKRIPKETVFLVENIKGCPPAWSMFFKKNGTVFEAKKLYDNQIPDWIVKQGESKYGRNVETRAALLINTLAGTNLYVIDQELNKLDIGLKPGEMVTYEAVKALSGNTKVYTLFDLGDVFVKKDIYQVMKVINYLIRDGNVPLMLLGYLTKMLFQISEIHDLKQREMNDGDITKKLKIHPFVYKKYSNCVNGFSLAHLRKIHFYLTEADILLKSGASGKTVLENCMIKCLAPFYLRRGR